MFDKEDKNGIPQEKRTNIIYYGVYTPDNATSKASVFEDKTEALKLAKKNKKSRFKPFQYYHEAAEFSLNGFECPNNNTTVDGTFPKKNGENSTQNVGEKASPFRGPKPQELVEFRKFIENGDTEKVKQLIWNNPRLLVSSGDTPSILQEGARQNALHIAAKAKNAELTQLILDTISNPDFFKELYGDDNQESAEERCRMLLDFYLNTPNKGLNETPLHFAAKFGAKDVVEILVSYPQCDKTKRNKFNATAVEINCTRADVDGKALKELQKQIDMFLSDAYYVPVLRSEDSSIPPVIGEPFNPTEAPILNTDPLSPRLEIHAYAGPMNKKSAEKFRRVWKTPPRSLNFNSPNGKKDIQDDLIHLANLKLKDPQKGLEKIGKTLSKKFDVYWKEYWGFLDCFVDIASEEGLDMLEIYLRTKYNVLSSGNKSRSKKNKSSELNISFTQNVNESEVSPISNLCNAFSNFNINSPTDEKIDFDPLTCIDKACSVFANRISNSILYILCCDYDNIFKVLENEIKQLESLINSYMEDDRFSTINFQKVHPRLGTLIGRKLSTNVTVETDMNLLSKKIESVLDSISKSLDYFSSDDEANQVETGQKPTIHRRQLVCLMREILLEIGNFEEIDSDWSKLEACTCVYHLRKKKNPSRSNSFKNNSKGSRFDLENVCRKLLFDERQLAKEFASKESSSEEEEDDFYTPPDSPSFLLEEDGEEEEEKFIDAELSMSEVYLEGNQPTDTDRAVYEALKISEVDLDRSRHPNVYRWRHNLKLFSESERNSWPSPKNINGRSPMSPISSSAIFNGSGLKCSTPSKSWLRITGANSPLAARKSNL